MRKLVGKNAHGFSGGVWRPPHLEERTGSMQRCTAKSSLEAQVGAGHTGS